jgi:asparaginyl-tRNA synthetase
MDSSQTLESVASAAQAAPHSSIEAIGQYEGGRVTLRGWLRNKRSSGKIHFLMLRDGTGTIQGVASRNDVTPDTFELMARLSQETSLEVTGKVRADQRAPGGFELNIDGVTVIGESVDFPITPKDHGVEFLMDNRHLWLRSQRQHAILRIRHTIMKACHDFLDEHGFLRVDSPVLTPSACEGTTTLFSTDYFGTPAFLTQSGQLYNEAHAMAFGKVYCFGPTFRAEKSKTRRHLMEFWMVEPEMAFCEQDENMQVQEAFVSYVVAQVLEHRQAELKVLERDVTKLAAVQAPFPRLSYDEAVEILRAEGKEFAWGDDFGAEDETILSNRFDRPVFVHSYPSACKAFYMKHDPKRPEVARCADLLAPEGYGEIIGGGQREDDLQALEERIQAHELPAEAYSWYLDLRRYGSVPHAGFGMGIERVVAWVCGIEHVRETIPFARLLNRMHP